MESSTVETNLNVVEPVKVEESEAEETTPTCSGIKRDRDEEAAIDTVCGVFLRSVYPLDKQFIKSVTVGVFEILDCSPGVMINHFGKTVLFGDKSWGYFTECLDVLDSNLTNNQSGKKTRLMIPGSEIEIDNMKIYGKIYIRIRDGNQQEDKVLITKDEFYVLKALSSPVKRYLDQLKKCEDVVKEYLNRTLSNEVFSSHIVFGDLDTYIVNRLPQEVQAYKSIMSSPWSIDYSAHLDVIQSAPI